MSLGTCEGISRAAKQHQQTRQFSIGVGRSERRVRRGSDYARDKEDRVGSLFLARQMDFTDDFSFSEMQRRTGLLQRHLIEEMGSHMVVICKAKAHAETALKGIRASAESNGP